MAQDSLRPRQEIAVRRFTQYCRSQWGNLLLHKVGTGKTVTSMAIGLNSLTTAELGELGPDGTPLRKMYIVSPSAGIFQNFTSDLPARLRLWEAVFPPDRLVSYPYSDLIDDINNKSWRYDMSGSIVIFDEAHRLLSNDIFNSREAGSRTQKHPILEDIYFLNKIRTVKKCIVMTGTPIQVDLADVCRLLNFVSQKTTFRTDVFAAVAIERTIEQFGNTMLLNLLKSKGAEVAGIGLTLAASKLLPATPAFLAGNPMLLGTLGVLGATVIAAGTYIGSKHIDKKKRNAGIVKKQNGGTRKLTRKVIRGGGIWDDIQQYITSDVDVGRFTEGVSGALGSLSPASVPLLTVGPLGPGKALTDTFSKFGIDMYIAGFQESTEELYLNNWNVEDLAKAASQYISVYDPSLQVKLKTRPNVSYNSLPLSAHLQNRSGLQIRYYDDTNVLDMPKKLQMDVNLSYNKEQLQLLRAMFTGTLTYDQLSWLQLDRYEAASPDVKSKYKFFRSYGRMVGNYSPDMLRYYTVINADGTDYDLYERATGRQVVVSGDTVFFQCEKFDHCLQMILRMRKTGTMKVPSERQNQRVFERLTQPLASAKDALKRIFMGRTEGGQDVTEADAEAAGAQVNEEAQAQIHAVTNEIPQPHLQGENQYLPLVYSYTEDYGLGPFCIYLKSKGYQYILAHTKQAPDVLVATINRGKSAAPRNPLFAPMTDATQFTDKLCVLLHPSMTEGYDFVYNPAIFVLEPCNTFGDQEQVYGRVLRSYSAGAIQTFGGQPRNKLIVQYVCLTDKDSWILTKLYAVWAKGKFWDSRIYLTPQQYIQTFQRASITSPDIFGKSRLDNEKGNLEAFQVLVKGGIQFSDILESLDCMDTLFRERGVLPSAIRCDPESGVPCANAVIPPVRVEPEEEEEEEENDREGNVANERPQEEAGEEEAPGPVGIPNGLRHRRGGQSGYRRTRRKHR
jgi:hypothetical protein